MADTDTTNMSDDDFMEIARSQGYDVDSMTDEERTELKSRLMTDQY